METSVFVENKIANKKKLILFLSIFLLVLLFLIQALIDNSTNNLLSCFFVCISAFFTACYIFRLKFIKNPISIFAIVAFNFSTQTGALLVQSFSGVSLTFNLQAPEYTFVYLFIFQVTLIFSHFIYANVNFFVGAQRVISTSLFSKLGIFSEIPTPLYWVFGGLGLLAIGTGGASEGPQYGDVFGKALQAFRPFLYFPYLLIFKKDLNRKRLFLSLIIFTLILIMFGFMKNSRGVFATAFVVVLFSCTVHYFSYRVIITKKLFRLLTVSFVGSLIILKILTDFADAMVIARTLRGEVSGVEMMKTTIDIVFDENALEIYRKSVDSSINDSYNEIYISNPLFARLITTKFEDSLIYFHHRLSSQEANRVTETTLDKAFALLPTPLLKLFSIDVDKSKLDFSIADLSWYELSGTGLGGYRVTPLLGHGLIVFGISFFLLVFFTTPLLYLLLDSFVIRLREGVVYSPLILISLYSVYKVFTTGSIVGPLALIVRGLPQLILLFLFTKLCFSIVNHVAKNQGRGL